MDPAAQSEHVRKVFRNLIWFGVIVFSLPLSAHAASLYISPMAQNVTVGQAFTVSAYVSSSDRAMNAASGDISFPSNKLQVLSLSRKNSILNLWIREPSFTNSISGGDVHFEGIALNPGFTGTGGNLITITFEAVGVGEAPVSFSSGAVLANDGSGTNILDDMQLADITISPKPATPVQPSTPAPTASITVTASSSASSTATSSTTPPLVVRYIPLPDGWKKALTLIAEWGMVAIVGILLLAIIVFLSLNLVYRIRKWRASSERSLLEMEETLRNDLKRIQKELHIEEQNGHVSLSKKLEQIESDIRKDIQKLDELINK
jgi:hypothetical protein